jgi:hypothetical protein
MADDDIKIVLPYGGELLRRGLLSCTRASSPVVSSRARIRFLATSIP